MSGLPDLSVLQPGVKPPTKLNLPGQAQIDVLNGMIESKKDKKVMDVNAEGFRVAFNGQYYSEWKSENIELARIRSVNQAFLKTLYARAKEYVEKDLEEDSNVDRYFGTGDFGRFVKESIGAGSASRFIYFTVNPKPQAQGDFASIALAVEKCTSKVWIKRYMLSYEQRGLSGTPEFGTGLHLNLLVEKKEEYMAKKPAECLREVKNTFKKLCEVQIAGILTMRYAPVPDNFVEYIKGNKEEEKIPLVDADRQWRGLLGIPDILGNWDSV